MIPFAIPQDYEVINISQIIRIHAVRPDSHPDGGEIEVYFSDGQKRIYSGDAAKIVNIEVHFALNLYRQMQLAHQREQTGIITPDSGQTRLM